MNKSRINLNIPREVLLITDRLQDAGFEAYLVGGCVRDLLLNIMPQDWDVTSNATPKQIEDLFEHTFYENDFGTVGVVDDKIEAEIQKNEEKIQKYNKKLEKSHVSRETLKKKISELENKNVSRETLRVVEVTPYRLESKYSNNRHPDKVEFSEKLEDDLKRRDFTINALCYDPKTREIIDLYGGIADLNNKEIKTVGDPDDRFQEDALRMLRALRFTAQLCFTCNVQTTESIKKNHELLKNISKERIRDEFIKILMSSDPMSAFSLARELNILDYISNDFERGIGCEQNGAHVYDVFEHLLRTMQHAVDRNWALDIRLAGLFHDISKPETKRWNKEKNDYTFYGHEVVGARVTEKNLRRLRFDGETTEKVTKLVRNHMFFSDPDKITLSAVRRIIRNVGGEENVWDLIKLRICDRIGMGRPKAEPYRLRQYQAMMEEAMRSPISVTDLKIDGNDIMKMFHVEPGPKIGLVLNALMGITLFEPEKNNKKFLMKQVEKYLNMTDDELRALADQGKAEINKKEAEEIKKLHVKHHVK